MQKNNIVLDTGFPGASAGCLELEADLVRFAPDLRGCKTWWFYWGFRIMGAEGKKLRFVGVEQDGVTPLPDGGKPVTSANGPAFSLDQGRSWQWLGTAARNAPAVFSQNGFEFNFAPEENEVWFSFGMAYTRRDWTAFLETLGESPRLKKTCLAERNGLRLEALRAGAFDCEPKRRIMATARHHACEMMANYAMEGMVAELLNDAPAGSLREETEFLFIPFVDVGGVENGEQGKNRLPHDHNRDYGPQPDEGADAGADDRAETSLYWEVAAVRHTARMWGRQKLAAVFDLHCPWARGGRNESVFQVLRADAAEQRNFGEALRGIQGGDGLGYRGEDDIPYGVEWNKPEPDAGQTCTRYMSQALNVPLATVFEIPYSMSNGRAVTRESARAFGRDLIRALDAYTISMQSP